jgi:general secretion pathway protein D
MAAAILLASGAVFFMMQMETNSAWAQLNQRRNSNLSFQRSKVIGIFDFRDARLREVLQLFSEMTGKNVVATPEIQDLEISLYLQKVEPLKALEVLCKNYNLWFTDQEDIIRVMKVEEYGRELVLRRDERTKVFNLKYASCLTVAEMIANIFGERVRYAAPEDVQSYGHVGTDEFPTIGEEIDVDEVETDEEKFRVRDDDFLERGGIVLDADDLAKLGRVVQDPTQLTPEELLELQIGRARALLTVFPRNNSIVVRSVDSNLVGDIGNLITEVDTPTRQVLLETKILRINLDDTMESFFNFRLTPGGFRDPETGIYFSDGENFNVIESLRAGSLTSPETFVFSYINSQVEAEFELLEQQGRINEISTPLVFVANNAAAKFFQGDRTPVRTGYSVTEATFTDEGLQTSPAQITIDYDQEDLGVSLEISPSINEDRTVTMKIKSEISTLNLGGGPPFLFTFNGVVQEGETDSVLTTQVEDIIVAKDGHSIVIGGLIEEVDRDIEQKVPILGDLPVLGFFFRNDEIQKRRSEIIFLITPRIVMDPEEGGELKDRVMKKISDHPYYMEDTDRVVTYDPETDKLNSVYNRDTTWRKFPWNIRSKVKELVKGNRQAGALIEIGD